MKRILYVQHANGEREITCPRCKDTRLQVNIAGSGDDTEYIYNCPKCGWNISESELDVAQRHEKQVRAGY